MDQELIDSFRAYLTKVSKKINRTSFGQEPNYTAAFFGCLHEEKFMSKGREYLALKLECSVSNDRGQGSAESKTGIDIGIVVKWEDDQENSLKEKAILLQAKNKLPNIGTLDAKDLQEQCEKMKGITDSYCVMTCPYDGSIPKIARSSKISPFWKRPLISLDDYFIDTVFMCLDGDTENDVVERAKRADRTIQITTNSPVPSPKQKNTASRKSRR